MEKLLAVKPEGYRKIIKRSLLLYRKSFTQIYLLALAITIIAFIPRFLSLSIGENVFFNLGPFDPHHLWLLIINLVVLMLFLSMLWRIHGVIDHLHEPLREDLFVASKKIFYVFIAAIIETLFIFFILAIILGLQLLIAQYMLMPLNLITMAILAVILAIQFFVILYVYTLFFFLSPLIVIENKGIVAAIRRSISLVWNHWWRTFSVQITPWICYFFVFALIQIIFHINIFLLINSQHPYSFLITCIHVILFSLFIPWVAALLIVQLKDLELRKELVIKKNVRKK